MIYLITGATGDSGSRVVERLLERGDRPRIFVRDMEKARARYGDRVDIAVGDLADARSLLTALEGVGALFLVNSGPELVRPDAVDRSRSRLIDGWRRTRRPFNNNVSPARLSGFYARWLNFDQGPNRLKSGARS
jgi:uncharacterized protein YbjT (DUF2867 family)